LIGDETTAALTLAGMLVIISRISQCRMAVPLTKAKLRELRDLARKNHRESTGRFVVDGLRSVREAIDSSFRVIELFATQDLENSAAGQALLAEARKRSVIVAHITAREMEQISDTVTAQGVLAMVEWRQWSVAHLLATAARASLIVALDAVADPGNVGSIIRTCDWFGAQALVLGRNSVDVHNPKVVRSTMGSLFHVPVLGGVDLPEFLGQAKEQGYTVYAAAADGDAFADQVTYAAKVLVVLGNEAWGVSDPVNSAADVRLAIRRHGAAESLNVGVACGILLAAIRRQRTGTGD